MYTKLGEKLVSKRDWMPELQALLTACDDDLQNRRSGISLPTDIFYTSKCFSLKLEIVFWILIQGSVLKYTSDSQPPVSS